MCQLSKEEILEMLEKGDENMHRHFDERKQKRDERKQQLKDKARRQFLKDGLEKAIKDSGQNVTEEEKRKFLNDLDPRLFPL